MPLSSLGTEGGEEMYSIGELSELAGASARTLRYYDRLGLLKPAHTNEAGYRFYGEREVDLLQQILFYRERGFDLKTIRHLLCAEDYDVMRTLEEHLLELERQRDRMNSLISLVERSIRAVKGEENMSDKEKFEAFKERAVERTRRSMDPSSEKNMEMKQWMPRRRKFWACQRRITRDFRTWVERCWSVCRLPSWTA